MNLLRNAVIKLFSYAYFISNSFNFKFEIDTSILIIILGIDFIFSNHD